MCTSAFRRLTRRPRAIRSRLSTGKPKCTLCRRRIPGGSKFKANKPTCYWCKERLGLV